MRTRRRLWLAAVAVAVMVSLVVAAFALLRTPTDSPASLAESGQVTASSIAPGYSLTELLGSVDSPAERAWRSDGEAAGSWVEVRWPEARPLRSIEVTRGPLSSAGVVAGVLEFDDGSALQVTFREGARRLDAAFSERLVRSVRFVVTGVVEGAPSVALSAMSLNSSPEAVVAGASDAAPHAQVRADSGTDAAGLTDGRGWRTPSPVGAAVSLSWARPRELAAVEVIGATSSAVSVTRATLRFDDGAVVILGGVESDDRLSTKVAFVPRSVRAMSLTVDGTDGDGALELLAVRLWEKGSQPDPLPEFDTGTTVRAGVAASCAEPSSTGPVERLRVLCPSNGDRAADDVLLSVAVPEGAGGVRAEILPSGDGPSRPPVEVGGTGAVQVRLALAGLPAGPVTVRLVPLAGDERAAVLLQLVYGAARSAPVPSSSAIEGRTLVWSEEFDAPVSVGRDGVGHRYGAGKPERWGYADFGSAVFADPSSGLDTVGTLDDQYLRLAVRPAEGGGVAGGMLASAHPGGAGFSAQYGYFEARVQAPAQPGTWPAFWMLPSRNLIEELPAVAEIDAVELYGHAPLLTCHTTHSYVGGEDPGQRADCGDRFDDDAAAARWHTYGVSIEPSRIRFFIDGEEVARAPQVGGGDEPMFFLANLALGGGWPVDLSVTGGRADLYVDYVRVYV